MVGFAVFTKTEHKARTLMLYIYLDGGLNMFQFHGLPEEPYLFHNGTPMATLLLLHFGAIYAPVNSDRHVLVYAKKYQSTARLHVGEIFKSV